MQTQATKKLVEANQQIAAKQEVGASNKDWRGGQMLESKRSVSIKWEKARDSAASASPPLHYLPLHSLHQPAALPCNTTMSSPRSYSAVRKRALLDNRLPWTLAVIAVESIQESLWATQRQAVGSINPLHSVSHTHMLKISTHNTSIVNAVCGYWLNWFININVMKISLTVVLGLILVEPLSNIKRNSGLSCLRYRS